jgi:hypothetical protein
MFEEFLTKNDAFGIRRTLFKANCKKMLIRV